MRSAPVWGTLQPFNVSVSAIFLLSFQNQSVGDRGQWSQLSCFWTHRSSSSRGETSLPQRLHNKGKIQPLHNTLQISNLDSNKELARLPNSVAVTNGLRSLTIQILHNTEKKDLDKILSNHIQGYTKKKLKDAWCFQEISNTSLWLKMHNHRLWHTICNSNLRSKELRRILFAQWQLRKERKILSSSLLGSMPGWFGNNWKAEGKVLPIFKLIKQKNRLPWICKEVAEHDWWR